MKEFGAVNPAIGFHPDEGVLYVAENGHLSVHELHTAAVVEAARTSVTRGFTPAECETYLHTSCDG